MKTDILDVIDYFAKSNVSFAGAFIEKKKEENENENKEINRYTNPFCGGLILAFTGSACLYLNGAPYKIKPGVIIHAGPGMEFKIKGTEIPWSIGVVHYKLPQTEGDKYAMFKSHYSFNTGESVKMVNIFNQLYEVQTSPGASAIFRGKQLFLEFLGEIFYCAEKYNANDETALIEKIIEFIKLNYSKGLNINQIAAHFKINRRKLAPLFKQYVGMTPREYLTECRILKAKELLYSCDCPIKQIADSVGYADSLLFSRAFKIHTGVSPTKYREFIKNY